MKLETQAVRDSHGPLLARYYRKNSGQASLVSRGKGTDEGHECHDAVESVLLALLMACTATTDWHPRWSLR